MKNWKMWLRVCLVLLFCTSISTFALAASPGVPVGAPSPYSAMVSTAHPLSSQVGAQILAKGGNAVDAAIAVQFALNVVEPMMSGIGGGGFMMIYLADENKVLIIDSREKAPSAATPDMFLKADGTPMEFEDAVRSGNSVGVPGTLMGLYKAYELYGTLPWVDLIEPAIELAEKGHKINRPLAESIKEEMKKFNDAAKKVFAPKGEPLPEGTLLLQPDLAKTFRLIRDYGPAIFYGKIPEGSGDLLALKGLKNADEIKGTIKAKFDEKRIAEHAGEIGKAVIETVRSRHGRMTMEDLAGYEVALREPVRGTYRGYEIVTMCPPSSGGLTLLQMLKILEGFDIKSMGPYKADTMHLMIETMHLAYADRGKYLADGDFVDIPYKGYLNPKYIEERRALIDMKAANQDVQPGDPWKYEDRKQAKAFQTVAASDERGETTHFTVLDKWGNMVSYTTTIEEAFGSGMMVPGYGFMLNNEMTDFDFTPGGINQVEPNKRPRSSMTPTIVFKGGKPAFSVGSPGGSTIIVSVLEVITNLLDHGMSIQRAIDAPRFMSSKYPDVSWERGIPKSVRIELEARGHKFKEEPTVQGSVQSIVIDLESGKIYGGADPRREGTVIGVL